MTTSQGGTPPGAPTSLVATAGDGEVDLAWDAPGDVGSSAITGYKIYRDTASPATTLLDTIGDVLLYNDASVSNDTEYFYRVKATNSAGDSDFSNEDSATPAAAGGGITFVGSAASRAAAASIDISGLSLQENDIVIYFGGQDTAGAPALPTGYSALATTTSNSADSRSAYKRMGASPDSSVSGLTSTLTCGHLAVVFRGVHTTTAIDQTTTTAVSSTNGDPNSPSIDTVTDGAMVVTCAFLDDDIATVSGLSGYTLVTFGGNNQYQVGSSGSGGTLMAAYLLKATAGTEDPGTFTTSGADAWSAHTIALRPA